MENKNDEILIHENQTTIKDFEYDFKMDLEEFNHRCFPSGSGKDARGSEFELFPVDKARNNGIVYKIETVDNVVYFRIDR